MLVVYGVRLEMLSCTIHGLGVGIAVLQSGTSRPFQGLKSGSEGEINPKWAWMIGAETDKFTVSMVKLHQLWI